MNLQRQKPELSFTIAIASSLVPHKKWSSKRAFNQLEIKEPQNSSPPSGEPIAVAPLAFPQVWTLS